VRTLYYEHFKRAKTRKGSILLFYAKILDKRNKDGGIFVTNVAGLRTINLQKTSLDVTRNPYLKEHQDYFKKIKAERAIAYIDYSRIHSKLIRKQKGLCPICQEPIEPTQQIEADHIIPYKDGGKHKTSNLRLVH